jgi:predicted esterase
MNRITSIVLVFLTISCYAQNESLKNELANMVQLDQVVASNSKPPEEYSDLTQTKWESFKDSIFKVHKIKLENILNEHGYPGFNKVGEMGEFHFWLLAQHCDFDPSFQKRVLDSMKIHVKNQNASPTNFAYLTDRYQLNIGEKQLYGTQVKYDNYGKAYSKSIQDSIMVNKRREEIGMPQLEYYLNNMSVQHYEMNEENLNKRGIMSPSLYCQKDDSVWSKGKLLSKQKVGLKLTDFYKQTFTDGQNLLPEYSYLDSLDFYRLTYQSDNEIVQGFSIEPKFKNNSPVIVFNRGGNREHGRLSVKSLLFATSKLGSAGYIILASNYRDNDEFGGSDIQDVLSLINITSEFDGADTSRIGMFGWSRGGMMTYLAVKNTDRVKTVVVGNGVSDLFKSITFRPEMEKYVYSKYIPNYWENKEQELTNRSVIYWTDKLNKSTSFLLLSGTNDQLVNPSQSENLAKILAKEGYKCNLKSYPTGHGFRGYREELNDELIKWFNNEL